MLNPITLRPIDKGAYTISYSILGQVTSSNSKVFLTLGSAENLLDITGRSRDDVLGKDNLIQFLKLISQTGSWGQSADCKVLMYIDNKLAASSNVRKLACPVKPYFGPVTFDGIRMENPPLTYPGKGVGRIWTLIDGKRYFCLSGKLETDNSKRGFDCTTFPMALYDCYPNMNQKYGTALADALHAQKCNMEQKKAEEVKAFFSKEGRQGTYFVWSAGHVVLVENAIIHEFTYGGYKRTLASDWSGRAPQGLWWVRKLPLICSSQ